MKVILRFCWKILTNCLSFCFFMMDVKQYYTWLAFCATMCSCNWHIIEQFGWFHIWYWIFQYFQPTLLSGRSNSLHYHNNLPNSPAFSLNFSFFLCIGYKERHIFVLRVLLWRAPDQVEPISLSKPIEYWVVG